MTTQDKTPIRALIEAVEAGDMESPPIGKVFGFTWKTKWASAAYKGSLDAAEALHEALLPGWEWRGRDDSRWWVWRTATDMQEAEADNPARAWLLSILRAYEARQ